MYHHMTTAELKAEWLALCGLLGEATQAMLTARGRDARASAAATVAKLAERMRGVVVAERRPVSLSG